MSTKFKEEEYYGNKSKIIILKDPTGVIDFHGQCQLKISGDTTLELLQDAADAIYFAIQHQGDVEAMRRDYDRFRQQCMLARAINRLVAEEDQIPPAIPQKAVYEWTKEEIFKPHDTF